jgi:hypothetical protein
MEAEETGREVEKAPRSYYPDYVESGPRRRETPAWDLGTEQQITSGRVLGKGLAWFSIGLGLMEVFAPTALTDFLGVDEDHAHLVQLYGMREIASGLAILAERTPKAGVWSRVPGDAIDIATLSAFARETTKPTNVLIAMGMVAGVTALDVKCAMQLSAAPDGTDGIEARRRAA